MMTKLLSIALLAAPVNAFAVEPPVSFSSAAFTAAVERLAGRCAQSPLPVDALLSDKAFRADLALSGTEDRYDLLFYSACRSFQGDADGCAPLEGLGASFAPVCKHIVAEGRLVFSVLRGDALSACRIRLGFDGKSGASVERGCAALIKAIRAGDAASACPALAAEKLVEPGESCPDSMIYWKGAPAQCDAYKDAGSRLFCRENAALAAGLRDPSRCAASPACLALAKKSPKPCEAARARYAGSLCARVARDLAEVRKQQALDRDRLRQGEAAFKAKAAKEAEAKAAAAAAQRAKAEEALARSKAESERAAAQAAADIARAKAASAEKAAKLAEEEAAKKAKAAEAVKIKADLEARKAAVAQLKIQSQKKPQFKKGESMQTESPEAAEMLKALQEGRPIPQPKPAAKPKAIAPVKEAPPDR